MLCCNPASLSSWGLDKKNKTKFHSFYQNLSCLCLSLFYIHLMVKPGERRDIYLLCLFCFGVWFFNCNYLLLISWACVTPACGSGKRKQAFCSFEDRRRSPHTQCLYRPVCLLFPHTNWLECMVLSSQKCLSIREFLYIRPWGIQLWKMRNTSKQEVAGSVCVLTSLPPPSPPAHPPCFFPTF